MTRTWSILWATAAAVLWCARTDAATGYYTVVAPKVLRPNTEYHVAVSTMNVAQPTTVVVDVGGRQDSGGNFKTSQFVTVEPYVTRIVRLEIGDVGPGSYNLTAEGTGGINFINSTALEYVHKSYSVFIQTDKAIYKPGHKVQFRAIVLNSHLKPSVTGALDIFITDGKGNRVKQWSRALTTRGVFSGELELSENPVLGDWNITVTVLDQVFHKGFQVAEYVLPKFEVSVDVAKHATFKDSKVVATVRAKYTYGRAVKGEATISAYPIYYSGIIQPIFQAPIRKVFPIDGKAVVEFDIVKELRLTDESYERAIQFDVAVEETLTGRRQNTTAQTLLHKHKYKMELVKTSEYFKPGLKYTAFIKLSHHDGTPVQDKTNPVRVRHGFSYNSEEYTETQHKLSPTGLVELVYYPPATNVTTLGIEAEYLDIKEWFSTVSAAVSPSDSFIQAVVKTEKPMVNQDIEIEVNSTTPLKYISYQVLGRGDVIIASTVQTTNGENGQMTISWRFLATYAMAPTAHIVVQYVREDGEVVADALDVELEGVFQNFVNIQAPENDLEPGANVELTVEAKPNSYVGLLGIDQSVLLLKTGNDIMQDDVLDELRSYDNSDSNRLLPFIRGDRDRRALFRWPGSFTAQEAFDKSGALIMTNGYVHEHNPWLGKSNSGGTLRAINRPPNRRYPFPGQSALKPDLGPPVVFRSVTRPPLAGPYAFSRIPTPVWNRPRVFLLHDIADTWLFANFSSGFDGKTSLRKTVPDTITSWVITAFSVDPLYGLGLMDSPKKVRVFRRFFVSIDLPYSVVRGEIVAIPVVVFNYMDRDLVTDVTLENSGQFDFADYSNDVNDVPAIELYRRKKVKVPANSGASTSFMISPKQLGYISIKVTATSPLAGDAVDRKLLVKAEGETQYRNKAIFVDLRTVVERNSFSTNFTLDIPVNIVPESEFIEVSAVGDLLGPSIPNLAHLIKMPYGCGEQNMLNFVPNIVIIEYLKNTHQLTQAIESKALRYLEKGYQQELTYKRNNGSFSAFGSADPSGSTWLTAFVARSFRQAMPYISIEEKVIMEALQWLASNQAPNGSFPEVGQVSHKDMQGGSAKGLALTAYTLLAFLENSKATPLYKTNINRGIDYIVRNLNGLEDPYAIAICAYTLQLAQHPVADIVFNLLESAAQTTIDTKWWQRPVAENEKKNPWLSIPNSVNIEMTSYALLTYLQRGLVEDALPIMRWMVSQQNDEGGFASTQDTVMALTALAKLAEEVVSSDVDISTVFSYNKGGATTNIKVNKANSMILQKHEIPRKVREIQINATGSGFAIVQVSYRYNVNVTGAWPLFTLDPQVDKNSDKNHLQLSICSAFVGGNESNMAVMEVALPSGFTIEADALPSLQSSQNVKRVETKEGDTVVVLYFDKMTREEYCPTVKAFRTHKVAKQKPAYVTMRDYYQQTRQARVFYEPRIATLCDICENEDCEKVCTSKPGLLGDGGSEKGAAAHVSVDVFVQLVATLFVAYAMRFL